MKNIVEIQYPYMDRFYTNLIKELKFYDSLWHELHYLNNITTPKDKEFRIKGAYPLIEDNIRSLIGDVSLPQDIAKLLGALRAKISLYNGALKQGVDSEILEEALRRINDLINPINTECFENYACVQRDVMNYERDKARQSIEIKK